MEYQLKLDMIVEGVEPGEADSFFDDLNMALIEFVESKGKFIGGVLNYEPYVEEEEAEDVEEEAVQ